MQVPSHDAATTANRDWRPLRPTVRRMQPIAMRWRPVCELPGWCRQRPSELKGWRMDSYRIGCCIAYEARMSCSREELMTDNRRMREEGSANVDLISALTAPERLLKRMRNIVWEIEVWLHGCRTPNIYGPGGRFVGRRKIE